MVMPPPAICTVVDSSASRCSGIRRDENEPSAHENAANTTSTNPIGLVLSVAPPGRSSSATPQNPTPTPASVRPGTRPPVPRRITTTHSGTDEITSAASDDGMYCSATFTTPFPPATSSDPTSHEAPSCLRETDLTDGAPR